MNRLFPISLVCWAVLFSAKPVCGSEDAESRWLHAYMLVQTGEEMAGQTLWPLALANYTAAYSQFQSLVERHPGFQRRLVDYRIADLKERIAQAQESMASGDHDLALHYEDLIETAHVGAQRRYALDFEGAYRHLVRANWQIEEMIERHPDGIAAALAKQRAFIAEITRRTREDLIREPDGALRVHNIEKDFAATVAVAMKDLPSFSDEPIAQTETGMSSALFPDEWVRQVRAQWY
ncbi:MAG: hypothetical protein JNK37_15900 [Verrucomicrobiales bacterium]|nr:hypothetical protein [Verrucomicrobiales bacterium]